MDDQRLVAMAETLIAFMAETFGDELGDVTSIVERVVVPALGAHPEFSPLWTSERYAESQHLMIGGIQPRAHVLRDMMIEVQVTSGRPDGVSKTFDALQAHGFTRTQARHFLAALLFLHLEVAKSQRRPFDRERYEAWLALVQRTLQQPTPSNLVSLPQVGRNDPCPCGSGRKLKKCCGDLVGQQLPLDPQSWVYYLPGGELYLMADALKGIQEDDPVLRLQNLSAVANALAQRGDLETAWLSLQQMEQLLLAADEEALEMMSNVLQDQVLFALNHPQFAARALSAAEILMRDAVDPDSRLGSRLDYADLLTYVGRIEEAETWYAQVERDTAEDTMERRLQVQNRREDWEQEIRTWPASDSRTP